MLPYQMDKRALPGSLQSRTIFFFCSPNLASLTTSSHFSSLSLSFSLHFVKAQFTVLTKHRTYIRVRKKEGEDGKEIWEKRRKEMKVQNE
jgi:hypothetical protein